ncbi:FAD:protein FMN transferase [Flavobacterium algicola]|uniref:FAD:protein FMN transferase n=1 Tax=Flavobacterium algicola TaxID=556529 RepID=UPI001EFE1B46|nr:FAD:protein FMN transferase [Flavobacterium algicola]MCG9792684.1 FAD:protein FMN transferase [Flavobacterium algicola]
MLKKLVSCSLITLFMSSCVSQKREIIKLEGKSQGTTYHIIYMSKDGIRYKKQIDSLLTVVDNSMSTWVPNSIISRINNNEENVIVDNYFKTVFNKSFDVSNKTEGNFDITVGPLINSWGFGPTTNNALASTKVDSLIQLVDYKKVTLKNNVVIKENPSIKIDFNAIAQGYSVDVIADFFDKKKVRNYLVELGGEIIGKGKKNGEEWKVGIDQPNEKGVSEGQLEAIINLDNKALATSGNYRKYYVKGDQKFSHIIDPKTGYPAKHNLLSTTVIAKDGITADAYATAFMVMGLKKSKVFLEKNKKLNLEVFFIYDENGKWKTFTSQGLKKRLIELPKKL